MDERLLTPGAYITDRKHLCQVQKAKTLGGWPNQRQMVTAEDAVTLAIHVLTENELAKYEFVAQGTLSDELTEEETGKWPSPFQCPDTPPTA